jgi:diguanylate cyclase (GGDEF)-like protein
MIWVSLNLIGLIILIFMYYQTDRVRRRNNFRLRLLGYLQIAVMLYLFSDTVLYMIEGTTFASARMLHYVLCTAYYLVGPLPGLFYTLFCDFMVTGDEKGLKRRLRFYSIPAAINSIVVLLSPLNGLVFYIDANNFYQRGDFLWISLLMSFGYILAALPVLFVKLRQKKSLIPKGYNIYLYLFPIPPFALAIAQLLLQGPLLLGTGYVISVFFMYFYIIQTSMDDRGLAERFSSISIAQFAAVAFIMTAGLLWTINEITDEISYDLAEYNSVSAANVMKTYLNKEIGVLGAAANSNALIEWFLDEDDTDKKQAAWHELTGTSRALYSNNLYIVVGESGREYTLFAESSFEDFKSHAAISYDNPDDRWVFALVGHEEKYKLNVDIDKDIQVKRVWLNYKVVADGEAVGVICTGMEFSRIVEQTLMQYEDTDTRVLIIDRYGVIQMDSAFLHEEEFLQFELQNMISDVVTSDVLLDAIDEHLADIDGFFPELYTTATVLELHSGNYRFAAITPIGATNWTVVTLYDPSVLFNPRMLMRPVVLITVLFVLLVFSLNHTTRRLFFTPIEKLVESLRCMKSANRQDVYGTDRNDEIGILSNTILDLFVKGHYDGLTGIYNRRYMEMTLQQLTATLTRADAKFAIMMMDVDFFKKYNDTYGHAEGDECLKSIAHALDKAILRSSDFVARYGGEEFVVVLPGTDESGARLMAEKILQDIRDLKIPHEKNDAGIVTISIGIAAGDNTPGYSWEDYLKKADDALYMSKENGRNQYTLAYMTSKEQGNH